MVRITPANILRDNEGVTKAAMVYGAQNNIETTQTVDVQGWPQEIPEASGVYTALLGMQKEGHQKLAALIAELEVTNDGRRKGELRRELNTKSKILEQNRRVLNALIDKRVESTKVETPKPKRKAEAATKRPTPAEVKKAAAKRKVKKPAKKAPQNREDFEAISYKDVVSMAKGMEIKAGGKKDEIVSRILDAL
jgi:hypothetical protein